MTRDQKLISVLELMVKNDVAHMQTLNNERDWLSSVANKLSDEDSKELRIFDRISHLSRMATCRWYSFDEHSRTLLKLRGLEPQS